MADKPKTYPQKVAELQEQLERALTDLADAERKASFVDELQNELSELKGQLQARDKQDQSGVINNKSQMVDLEARAVAAEGQLRNLRMELSGANMLAESLEQQLEIAGAERDRNLGKDQKIQQLSEEIKNQNLRIAEMNQRVADIQREANDHGLALAKNHRQELNNLTIQTKDIQRTATEQIARMEKQVHDSELKANEYYKQLNNVIGILSEDSDTITKLKYALRMQ